MHVILEWEITDDESQLLHIDTALSKYLLDDTFVPIVEGHRLIKLLPLI